MVSTKKKKEIQLNRQLWIMIYLIHLSPSGKISIVIFCDHIQPFLVYHWCYNADLPAISEIQRINNTIIILIILTKMCCIWSSLICDIVILAYSTSHHFVCKRLIHQLKFAYLDNVTVECAIETDSERHQAKFMDAARQKNTTFNEDKKATATKKLSMLEYAIKDGEL